MKNLIYIIILHKFKNRKKKCSNIDEFILSRLKKKPSNLKNHSTIDKHEARVLEACIDPSSCSTNENDYGIFNAAKMSCKYLYLLDHYNVVNLNINDYKGQITEYLDSLWAVSTPNRFPQILSSHLDRSRKSDDLVINEGLTNEELSLRKNVLYDHTI